MREMILNDMTFLLLYILGNSRGLSTQLDISTNIFFVCLYFHKIFSNTYIYKYQIHISLSS